MVLRQQQSYLTLKAGNWWRLIKVTDMLARA